MSCNHSSPKVAGRARYICAHPSCEDGFGGDALVTMEAHQGVGHVSDFTKIYIGPDGTPIHGRPGYTQRTYPRVRDADGWAFGAPTVEEVPAINAEDACRAAWAEHETRSFGRTDS